VDVGEESLLEELQVQYFNVDLRDEGSEEGVKDLSLLCYF
jgi:hypothetical protein